jgi:O-Antigen ligase.
MVGIVVTALPAIYRRSNILLQNKINLLLLSFAVWNVISTFWSANPLRGSITASLIMLGVLVFLSVQTYGAMLLHYRRVLSNTLKITTIGLGVFSLYQLFGDTLGFPSQLTLLPTAYMSHVFGFARITGFSAEPEFLGSFLLLPLGVFLYLAITKKRTSDLLMVAFCALLITLTLSRGALIASAILVILMLALCYKQLNLRRFAKVLGYGIGGVLVAVALFSFAAGINTRDDISARQAFNMAVNQVSLGTINLHQKTAINDRDRSESPKPTAPQSSDSGYVASSTDSRLQMSREALGLLNDQPLRFIYGIGSGSFGASLHAESPRFSEASIVNNQYVEIFTELGIIGLVLFASFLYMLFRQLLHDEQYIFIPIIVGILVQWLFFSGYPNVLHLWPILGMALILVPKKLGILR